MPRESFLKKIGGYDPLTIPLCRIGRVPVDGWTLVHSVIYFIFGLYGMGFLELFVTSIIWEYFEYMLDRPRDPHVISDFVANFVGFAIGYWARQRYVSKELPGAKIIRLVRRFGLPD